MAVLKTIGKLGAILVESIMLVIVGLIYFVVILFIIKLGANLMNFTISGDWAVLSASLIVTGILVGSSFQK